MLELNVAGGELYLNDRQEFVTVRPHVLQLEHSLISISKWESKWKIPFLKKEPQKTPEQLFDYIRCMTVTSNVDPLIYYLLTKEHIEIINAYIEDSQTATWFSENNKGRPNRETVTSELVYYWMIAHNIPSEYQKWHINRLLTLIRICDIKSNPPKKMSKKDMLSQRNALNEARRKQYGTKG